MIDSKSSCVKDIIEKFIVAFDKVDFDQMEKLLAPHMVGYITNPEAGVDEVRGRESYIQRIRKMNMKDVKFSVTITQIVTVAPQQGMVMVEIKADRKEKSLHNFASFLMGVEGEHIHEIWMVEALPAYSDEFWKA